MVRAEFSQLGRLCPDQGTGYINQMKVQLQTCVATTSSIIHLTASSEIEIPFG